MTSGRRLVQRAVWLSSRTVQYPMLSNRLCRGPRHVRTHDRSLEAFDRRRKTAAIHGVRGQVSAWLSYDLISPRGQSVIKISANQRTQEPLRSLHPSPLMACISPVSPSASMRILILVSRFCLRFFRHFLLPYPSWFPAHCPARESIDRDWSPAGLYARD